MLNGQEQDIEEYRGWPTAKKKIRRAEKVGPTVGSKWTHPGVDYFLESESGYWNCGPMTNSCHSCAAMHFLGERNRQPVSTLTNPKFFDCCSTGNVTLDFLLSRIREQCHEPFKNEQGHNSQSNPGE